DRTYSAEITRIGWAVRQPPASTHIVACTTCIAQALCSRQIFYHIRAFFASPFLKKYQTFFRSHADARPLGAQRPGALLLYYKYAPGARGQFHEIYYNAVHFLTDGTKIISSSAFRPGWGRG